MTGTTIPPAEEGAFQRTCDAVADFLDRQLEALDDLARAVVDLVPDDAIGRLTEDDLGPLLPQIETALQRSTTYAGHGFAAAPGVIAGHDHYLLWLQRQPTGIRRLMLNLDAGDPDLYDYHDTEWFSRPQRLRAPAVYGPYVDYAGADLVVLTMAVPVYVGGRFIGIAGADLFTDAVESRLTQLLHGLPGDAVIVNADRSVVAAGSARWMPGERLATHPADDPSSYAAVGTLGGWSGWVIALAEPEKA